MSVQRSPESGSVKRMWIWIAAVLGVLLIAAFVGLSMMAGSPKDAYGMLRYALPHMHRGKLKPGDTAPDASLLTLSGTDQFRIHDRIDRIGGRPLMIVFGSYT
jgi:hypothetical protein